MTARLSRLLTLSTVAGLLVSWSAVSQSNSLRLAFLALALVAVAGALWED